MLQLVHRSRLMINHCSDYVLTAFVRELCVSSHELIQRTICLLVFRLEKELLYLSCGLLFSSL